MKLHITDEVRDALNSGRPAVALESTLIAHGLPRPVNLEVAREAEAAVRDGGAVPATVAILGGVPTVGLGDEQLRRLAEGGGVFKASRRDLGPAVALGRTAATTVSATVAVARAAGLSVFATGGVGGVHPGVADSLDISADLAELARTPMLVVCAGAKNVLDLPKTLELLETLGVPVLGYRTDRFPAFYVRDGGLPVAARVETPAEAAGVFAAQRGFGGGVLLARPIDKADAISAADFAGWLAAAERDTSTATGPEKTPALLKRLADLSGGRTLAANRSLILGNARLAAELSVALKNF